MKRLILILAVVFAGGSSLSAADYTWTITYPYLADNDRKLASGDTLAVTKVVFDDVKTTSTNSLQRFWARIVTNYTGTAANNYLEAVQLWWDTDGVDGLQTDSDSLIDVVLKAEIPVQSTPTQEVRFTLGGGITLGTSATFYIALEIADWYTAARDDQEVPDGADGTWYGVTIQKSTSDLAVSPVNETSNTNWGGDHSIHFTIQGVELPITIRNLDPSVEEGAAAYVNENMFFPTFNPLNGTAQSKAQRIHELSLTARVYIPNSFIEDSLQQASFQLGWNNTVLSLDTIILGNIWDDAELTQTDPNFGAISIDTVNTNYSLVSFSCHAIGQPVGINDNYLATLDFDVIKPGISPLFLRNINIWDQWGVRYHHYQIIQNNLTNDNLDTTRYDAWAKYILGDYTGINSDSLKSGIGDSKVNSHDITLFGEYLFLGSNAENWYNRFDIGAEGFRDPAGIVQYDDTTNFYDLLIIGTNYYRNQKGEFLQKTAPENPLAIQLDISEGEQIEAQLNLDNVSDLLAAQTKIQYNPRELRFKGYTAGNWLKKSNTSHYMARAPLSENRGIVDMNFLSTDETLQGSGDFIVLNFEKRKHSYSPPQIIYFDPRNKAGEPLQYTIQQEEVETVARTYTTLYNYPNPFNPSTNIVFIIYHNNAGVYQLGVYDLLGNLVYKLGEAYYHPGRYQCTWDGRNTQGKPVGSGVYLLRLSGARVEKISKIILIR